MMYYHFFSIGQQKNKDYVNAGVRVVLDVVSQFGDILFIKPMRYGKFAGVIIFFKLQKPGNETLV